MSESGVKREVVMMVSRLIDFGKGYPDPIGDLTLGQIADQIITIVRGEEQTPES